MAVGCALFLVLGTGTASAHAALLKVDPADGALVPTAPTAVTLTFSEPVQVRDGSVRLLDASGAEQPITVDVVDSTVVISTEQLGTGTFILSWRVISADSHSITGGSTFSVGVRSAQVASAGSVPTDQVVQWTAAGVQALTYFGVLGLAGMVAFELVVLRTRAAVLAGRPRRRRVAAASAVTGAAGALLLIPMTSLRQSGLPLSGLGDPGTWTDITVDGPLLSALLIVAGLTASWWFTWRAGAGPMPAAVALGGAALALGALAVVGHTRVFGPVVLVLGADLLHVTVGAFWFGGLIGLAITIAATKRPRLPVAVPVRSRTTPTPAAESPAAVFSTAVFSTAVSSTAGSSTAGSSTAVSSTAVLRYQAVQRSAGPGSSPDVAVVLQRFSTIAAGLVTVLAITGALLGWRVLGSFDALFGTAYGITLLVKLGLVIPILGLAAVNRFWLLPSVVRAPDAATGWSRISRAVRFEAGALVAVLLVTGVLVSSNPVLPEASASATGAAAVAPVEQQAPLGAGTVSIVLTPGTTGVNSLEFSITDAAGAPLVPLADPSIRISMPAADIGPLVRPATVTGPGSYQASIDLPLAGEWLIEIGARTSQFDSPRAIFPVTFR